MSSAGPGSPFQVPHTSDSIPSIQESLAQKLAILIDVREHDEWHTGHLQQAELVPLSELSQGLEHPPTKDSIETRVTKEKIVYCHCKSGGRVLMAAQIMKSWGYDIRPLQAGFDDLVQLGFEQA